MALELKDVLEAIGFDGDVANTTPEQFEEWKAKSYIPRATAHTDEELINAITGKRIGSLETEMKRGFKALGIELQADEIKGKKLEEVYSLGIEKVNAHLEELKKSAKEGASAEVQKYMDEIDKHKKKQTEISDALEAANKLLRETEENASKQIKEFKLNAKLGEAKAKVPFSETVDEYTRLGFDISFERNYKVDLDEKDNLVITRADGSQITNKAGNIIMGFEEVYKEEASKAKLVKLNNADPVKKEAVKAAPADKPKQLGVLEFTPHPNAKANEEAYGK